MSNVNCILLSCRRFSFPDKETGKIVEGAKLQVSMPSNRTDDFVGLSVVDLKFPYSEFPNMSSQSAPLIGKSVVISTETRAAGKSLINVPVSIKAV